MISRLSPLPRPFFLAITTMLTSAIALAISLAAAPVISLTNDRSEPIYALGEPATFTLKVTDDGSAVTTGSVHVKLGVDGGKTLIDQAFDLSKANPVQFSGTLSEPGFLLATADGLPNATKALAGAAFDPTHIVSGNELPDDFKTFWEKGRAELANKPVQLEKLDAYSNAQITSYMVTVSVLHGEHLYGFLSIPTGAGKHPAIVTIPGAGPGIVAPDVNWAQKGVIALVMNVHKYPVLTGQAEANKKAYQEKLAKLYYPKDQATDRDRYHFHNVILGIDRAITEVAKRPDWDGEHFVMNGSSQGGGLTLILTGFNPHITAAAANVPALSDHGAGRFHRAPGWPKLATAGPKALEVSAYYDAANFARFIHQPTLVSAGFIDTTCAPSSVYAAWNRIPDERKKMFNMPTRGHTTPPEYNAVKDPWVKKYLGLK